MEKITIDEKTSEWLDAARGFSAIIVFIAHFNQIFNLPIKGLNGFYHLFFGIIARYGVIVFFILSGFLITVSIINNINKNLRFNEFSFFLNRFTRIYPPYIFSLILCVAIFFIAQYFHLHGFESFRTPSDLYLAREKFSLIPDAYYKALFLLNNFISGFPSTVNMNGPLWTITYEWWLYILAMFFAIWVKNKGYIKGTLPFIIIVIYLFYTSNYGFLWFSTYWIIGSIAALVYSSKYKLSIRISLPLLIILLSISLIYISNDWKILVPTNENTSYAFQLIIAIILTLASSISFLRWNTFTMLFKRSAKYSYTLYVIHFPLLLLSFSFLHKTYQKESNIIRFMLFFLVVAVILFISWFLSKFLEDRNIYKKLITKLIKQKLN